MDICKNIRDARKAADKTQQEVADYLNIKRTSYANWENTTVPSIEDIIRLGQFLNVPWITLVDPDLKPEEAVSNKDLKKLLDKVLKEMAELRKMMQK